jgi:hypothetical protein
VNGNIVNYKKFVSKALKILEMAAIYLGEKKKKKLKKDETFSRPPNQSAVEYLNFLKSKTSKKLPWNNFLETFEKSKFSDSEITYVEYCEFMKNFNEILKFLSS